VPTLRVAGGFDLRTSGRTSAGASLVGGTTDRAAGLVLPVRFHLDKRTTLLNGAPLRHVHTHQSVERNIHLASWYWLRITLSQSIVEHCLSTDLTADHVWVNGIRWGGECKSAAGASASTSSSNKHENPAIMRAAER